MAIRANVPIKLGPLVSINVTVDTAVQKEESLHTVCVNGHDAVRIKQIKRCPSCNAEDGFKKGQMVGDTYTVAEADAVKAATDAGDTAKSSMVITAHDLTDVLTHTLPGDSVYFLSPSKGHGDGYATLRELINSNGDKALVTEFAPRGRAAMWRFGVWGEVITLNKLVWPEDVKQPAPIDTPVADKATVAMASQFLDTLHQKFNPAAYRDAARIARDELMSDGEKFAAVAAASGDSPAAVNDLLSAFKASVGQAETKPKKKAAPRKRAAKKATAA